MIIKSLLDTDFYKFSMQQAIFHNYPATTAKFRFICRNKGVVMAPYILEITKELQNVASLRFSTEEIDFLRSQGVFQEDYLTALTTFAMNFSHLDIQVVGDDLHIEAEGLWFQETMWEIYTLAIVNEVYFRNTQKSADKNVARQKLMDKIQLIKNVNEKSKKLNRSPFKLIDFGTRRRFSGDWQMEVNEILKKELPTESFVGTSSVYVAKQLNIKPIGTFAHEWLQGHQVVTPNLIDSQKQSFKVWLSEYQGKLGIALSDIYGNKPFFKDFTKDLAEQYQGARHDSGDPTIWGEAVIAHYQSLGIDPKTKTLVFSDGLDVPRAIALYEHFVDRINVTFGIGTNLTNDFGFKALNIVMKMVACNNKPVCKISEEPSKAICDDPQFLDLVKKTFGITV